MIKGLIFRIIMLMVIAAGILSYIAALNGIDIRQFLPRFERPQLPSFKLPTMPEIKRPFTDEESKQTGAVRKIYQWRGEDGSWHFSEDLPEGKTLPDSKNTHLKNSSSEAGPETGSENSGVTNNIEVIKLDQ